MCSRSEVPTKGSPVGEGESRSWKGRVDDRQRSGETGGGIEKEGAGNGSVDRYRERGMKGGTGGI